MQRTTFSLPEELLGRLRRIAAEEGTSMAALVREAVKEKVEDRRPKPQSLRIGASRHSDTAPMVSSRVVGSPPPGAAGKETCVRECLPLPLPRRVPRSARGPGRVLGRSRWKNVR